MPLTKLNYVNGEITPAEPGFYLNQLVYLDGETAYYNEEKGAYNSWETPVTGWFVSGNTRTPVTSGNEIWLDEDWKAAKLFKNITKRRNDGYMGGSIGKMRAPGNTDPRQNHGAIAWPF